jgi:cardiolipin synthase
MFVARDNHEQRDAIERQYRAAIHAARHDVIIASAYFFPGYRLLRAMRRAVRRGVRVRLVLQGQPDMKIVKHAAELLQGQLGPRRRRDLRVLQAAAARQGRAGRRRMVDDRLEQPGSAQPSLNLEANVMIRDKAFAADVRARLERLIRDDCPSSSRRSQGAACRLAPAARYSCIPRHAPLPAVGWLLPRMRLD